MCMYITARLNMTSYIHNYILLRFLTFHCLLYNETSWCQGDSRDPSNNQTHLQNVSASSDQTSHATINRVLLRASDETLKQQLKTNSTAPSHDNNLQNQNEHSSKAANVQTSHQSKASMTAAVASQDYLNTIPTSGQTHSHNVNTGNDEATDHGDSLASKQVLTRQSQA